MLKVIATSRIYSSRIDAYHKAVRELVEKSNQEEGCVYYTLNQDCKDPSIHYFSECWVSKEALDAHMKTEHFTRLVPALSEYVEERIGEMILMEEVEF